MRRVRFLNTVSRKFVFGSGIMILFLVFFLLATALTSVTISNHYETATAELVAISSLQTAVSNVNDTVNQTYNFLQYDGIQKYPADRELLRERLSDAIAAEDSEQEYCREVVDLNHTVESYICESDELMEELGQYLQKGQSDTQSYPGLKNQYDNTQRLFSYVELRFQDTYAVRLTALSRMQERLEVQRRKANVYLTFILVCIVAICIIYLLTVVRGVSRSIGGMMAGVNRFRENVYDAGEIRIDSGDEFEELAEAFNHMTSIIRNQMKELADNADIRERLAEAEKENLRIYGALQKNHLDFLQSRINPHFLFNTLNMISSQARIENADKSAELIEITAAFLRYNLDSITKTVTLEQEINNLRDFIFIEKYRYGERFQFEIDIDPDCFDLAMPCMILQPLLENAIQHGIGMMTSGGSVTIRAKRSEDMVIIETEDNGIGMTHKQVTELLQDIKNDTSESTHIGIKNIYRRLQYFYGNEETELTIGHSAPGFLLRIRVPYRRIAEEQDNE